MPRKPLKERPNGLTEYLLKRIPVKLWTAVHLKAAAENPPVTVRWLILTHLRKYCDSKLGVQLTDKQLSQIPAEPYEPRPRIERPKKKPQPRKIGKFQLQQKKKAARDRLLAAPEIGEVF